MKPSNNLEVRYPTERLKSWAKAKELRLKYYQDYKQPPEKSGIRWAGSAASCEPLVAGFGRDLHVLTGEAYAANVTYDKAFAAKCRAATEQAGYPRDLCSYMRNYWGSKLIDEYLFGGPFPKPAFYFTGHICCSHAKWYQEAVRIEGKNTPLLIYDYSTGLPYRKNEKTGEFYFEPDRDGLRYVVDQWHEIIESLEKILDRPFQDELLFEAAEANFDIATLWTRICKLNQNIPAPLDEKSMFSLYTFGALDKSSTEFAAFYRELLDEVQDRVDRGIAAVPTERARVMSDISPPWGFLKIYRYLEEHGIVSIGSMYSMGLMFTWGLGEDGTIETLETPKERGIEFKDRDHCLMMIAENSQKNFGTSNSQDHRLKPYIMEKIFQQWHCDGVMMHFNRGCEGLSLNVAEARRYLTEKGIPLVSYEGNNSDDREFDFAETIGRIDTFIETLGLS